MSEDTEAPPQESTDSEAPAVKPETLKVEVTNPTKSDKAWNDSCDDMEYDEIVLSKEDKDI